MSYAGDLDAVARTLGVIGFHGTGGLTERDLDIALVARSSVLELATTVQFDLTGLRGGWTGPVGNHLEAHPAAAFADALARYPAVRSPVSPSDALGVTADTDVGAAWQHIARHAISANHHWTTGGYRPSDDVAWAGLADIAALGATVAELDVELGYAAGRFDHRQDDAETLTTAATSGLRIAARQVGELAATGPLAERGPEPRPTDNRGLVTITEHADVATAHEQLINLLRTAEHVRPERLNLLVIGHLRTCRAFLAALPEDSSYLRAPLARHEQMLAEVTRHDLAAASISGGDNRPLRQMQIIRQSAVAGSPLLDEIVADAVRSARLASALAETTVALQETAERHVTTGAWLLPDPRTDDLRWAPMRRWHDVPPYLQELRAVAVQAAQITSLTSPLAVHSAPSEERPRPSRARDLLAPAPFRPLDPSRRPLRPPQPCIPVARVVPRRR